MRDYEEPPFFVIGFLVFFPKFCLALCGLSCWGRKRQPWETAILKREKVGISSSFCGKRGLLSLVFIWKLFWVVFSASKGYFRVGKNEVYEVGVEAWCVSSWWENNQASKIYFLFFLFIRVSMVQFSYEIWVFIYKLHFL